MKRGKFVTRQKFILAEKITGEKQQTVIDKNGEEFIGLPGDWKVQDEDGYIYFLDKYKFKSLYQPYDEGSFDIMI